MTNGQTDGGQSDPYVALYFTGATKSHACEPVASKNLEKFSGELAKKLENFVGLRYIKNVGK